MVTTYMKDSNFQSFVQCNVALAFLLLVHLESTLEELRNWEFDKGSENFDEMVKFRDVFTEYIYNSQMGWRKFPATGMELLEGVAKY